MRFLVDENLSPRIAPGLIAAGHDAIHANELALSAASDAAILEAARADNRVIVSADTDFGMLLAAGGESAPSIILIRLSTGRRTAPLLGLLLANLDQVVDALEEGAIVVLEDERVRVRRLPLP